MTPKLQAALDLYIQSNTRITSDKTRKQYVCTFEQFSKVTSAKKLKHVTDDRLGVFLGWLRNEGYAIHTQSQKLSYLLALARYYAKLGKCPWPTIKPPQLPDLSPHALTLPQVDSLMKTAREWPGMVYGVPAGLWWGSIVDWFWYTAERTEATLTGIRLANIVDGTILVDAKYRKGRRKAMSYSLPVALIDDMRDVQQRGVDNVWHWDRNLADFYATWRTIYETAGLTYVPHKTGPHQLRKSHASWIEATGGNATESLGHSSRAVTLKSYIDRRIAKRPDFASQLPRVG